MTIAPDGRELLRLEVRNAQTPIEKKPSWIKTRATMGPEYTELKALVKREAAKGIWMEDVPVPAPGPLLPAEAATKTPAA